MLECSSSRGLCDKVFRRFNIYSSTFYEMVLNVFLSTRWALWAQHFRLSNGAIKVCITNSSGLLDIPLDKHCQMYFHLENITKLLKTDLQWGFWKWNKLKFIEFLKSKFMQSSSKKPHPWQPWPSYIKKVHPKGCMNCSNYEDHSCHKWRVLSD